jgi:hypothetical protein
MRFKRKTTRSLAVLLAAGALCLGLTASAAGVIYVYNNAFATKAAFKEIKRTGGGDNCDRRWRERTKSMGVTVQGKRLCAFSPPVVGDADQPDHAIAAVGQVLPKKTTKSLRKAAYLAVRVRLGRGDFYELQIRPRGRRYRVLRSPEKGVVSEGGQSNAINPLKEQNRLQLQVKGARVKASVNGKRLVTVVDPSPEDVSGRRTAFGLGNRKNANGSIAGVFRRVRVGIAE